MLPMMMMPMRLVQGSESGHNVLDEMVAGIVTKLAEDPEMKAKIEGAVSEKLSVELPKYAGEQAKHLCLNGYVFGSQEGKTKLDELIRATAASWLETHKEVVEMRVQELVQELITTGGHLKALINQYVGDQLQQMAHEALQTVIAQAVKKNRIQVVERRRRSSKKEEPVRITVRPVRRKRRR